MSGGSIRVAERVKEGRNTAQTLALPRSMLIARKDAEGRFVDFHALRVTFVTWLVKIGVHPKTVQILARHSSIETTMQAHADLHLLDFRGAVASLPSLGIAPVAKADLAKGGDKRGQSGGQSAEGGAAQIAAAV